MAKKVKKKRVSKRKPTKEVRKVSPKKIKQRVARPKPIRASARKIKLAFRNLILFVIISIASFLLQGVSTNGLLIQFFYLLGMITAFIAVAFLIVLLVFALLRLMGK